MLTRLLPTAAGLVLAEATPAGIARLEAVDPGTVLPGTVLPGTVPSGSPEPGPGDDDEALHPDGGAAAEHLARLADQLEAYCDGRLRRFDVPVDWDAAGVLDPFAREVYREIQHISYGETATYGQIGIDAGRPRNARRVGRLCSLVPVSFLIPVHRVIRADGGLGSCPGYRRRLLEHERRNLGSRAPIALEAT